MLKLPSRQTFIASGFALAAVAVVARAAQLSLVQGARWRARASAQQTATVTLPARRGGLYDRNGVALALSQESFDIGVAPRELDDPDHVAGALAMATGRPRAEIRAQLRSGRVWLMWPGPFSWVQVAVLSGEPGVHLTRRLDRFYPRPDLAPRLIGRLDARGRGGSGLERAFDSLLAGRAGTAVVLRDHRGRTYPAPSQPAADPIDGQDVVLTIDAELQEIAERALRQAVVDARASGGDVVILQPSTGEVLALASVRPAQGGGGRAATVGDPYEPGSTAKVFTAAGLLRTRKASPSDTVFAEHGTWKNGAITYHDTHPSGLLTLADVIRLSSNIGIIKFGSRLTPSEQFEVLRDFGFGTPTGIEIPGEAAGRLRAPGAWSGASAASLAMGYELATTPLQLAAAYAVFATGGVLLEPTLVRAVRGPDGEIRWRHTPRPVRRVVSTAVADQLAHMLRGVVEEGTGQRAALGTYALAGKTGTSRRNIGGHYVEGHYTASFVGLFPAVDPQLVLLVKIDDPEGDYFGGATAAPVTRTILEAALATPAVALDRARLSRRRAPATVTAAPAADPAVAVRVPWPLPADSDTTAPSRPVPDVTGQTLRAAARALHHSGFRVRVQGTGVVVGTSPAAGASTPAGAIIVVRAEGAHAR